MEFIKWTEDYSVKNEVLDNQHKRLFEIINELYTMFANNEHKEKVGKIITELYKYTIYHFTEEESLLREKGNPLPMSHVQKHQEFTEKVKYFKLEFETGNKGITYEIMNFLRQWLIQHIQGVDTTYSYVFG